MPSSPENRYKPGTRLTVGSHSVSITKYLSEGGFAHVYTCTISPPYNGSNIACLKRVVVPTKVQLNLLRREVDAMKRLKGNKHIVSYIDSHAARMHVTNANPDKPQSYEVFVLMEYCANNGLIDYMNTRLVDRLKENEVLKIMYDVTIGVAMCHNLQPPLLHRDIKIENVLIDASGTYKLCDFGSASNYLIPSVDPKELKLLHDDLMQNTTPQYRSPEMIDLSHGFPVDEKSDVWALGCFLYKLCYYTTPFESPSQKSLADLEMSILNCDKTLYFPPNQTNIHFSTRLRNIIKCCLRPDPRRRPNTTQLLQEICSLRGIDHIPNVVPHTVLVANNAPHSSQGKILKSSTSGALNLASRVPYSPKPENVSNSKGEGVTDPFASIDKSKLLLKHNLSRSNTYSSKDSAEPSLNRTRLNKSQSADKRFSLIEPSHSHAESASSLHSYIQQQLNDDSSESSDDYSNYNDNTLDFLKSREEISTRKVSNQRQNTGGSLRQSLKTSISRFSTGGSISRDSTGNSIDTKKKNRRSITSIKRLLSGSSFRNSTGNTKDHDNESLDLKSSKLNKGNLDAGEISIRARVNNLMNNKESGTLKTAKGYGRYTDADLKDEDDIDAINAHPSDNFSSGVSSASSTQRTPKRPVPPKVPVGLSSKSNRKSLNLATGVQKATPNAKVDGSARKSPPPPKPSKPGYLKSPSKHAVQGHKKSDSFSMPNLDDLEKQFSKRFPNFV